jgi:hypothetical protein
MVIVGDTCPQTFSEAINRKKEIIILAIKRNLSTLLIGSKQYLFMGELNFLFLKYD